MKYNFEWDPNKAKQNLKKHKVGFERAAEILLDPFAISVFDEGHSLQEDRWVTIGKDSNEAVLARNRWVDKANPTYLLLVNRMSISVI